MTENEQTVWDTEAALLMLNRLNEQRMKGQECGFHLSNGRRTIGVHACLIRAWSPVVDAACCALPDSDVFQLQGISDSGLDVLVQYLYSTRLTLNKESALDLYLAGNSLEIPFLQSASLNFMEKSLSTQGCVELLNLAVLHNCVELQRSCIEYCIQHFDELLTNANYLEIPPQTFIRIVSDTSLSVEPEERLLEAIRDWLQLDPEVRKEYAFSLSSVVRYQLIDVRLLMSLLHDEQVSFAHGHIRDAMVDLCVLAQPFAKEKWERRATAPTFQRLDSQYEEDKSNPSQELLSTDSPGYTSSESVYSGPPLPSSTDSPDAKSRILAVLGGRSADKSLLKDMLLFRLDDASGRDPTDGILQFDSSTPNNDPCFGDRSVHITALHSKRLRNMPSGRKGFGVASLSNQVFLIGGQPSAYMKAVQVYDVVGREWMLGPTMLTGRSWFGVVQKEQSIFVIGGSGIEGIPITNCEMLDTRTGRWQNIPAMPNARMSLSTCSDGHQQFFAVGGLDQTACDCFDLTAGKWHTLTNLTNTREATGVAYHNDGLYVFGGCSPTAVLDAVDRYALKESQWYQMAPMPYRRAFFATISFEEHALIIGGRDESGPSDTIQVYNCAANTWRVVADKLFTPRSSMGATLLHTT